MSYEKFYWLNEEARLFLSRGYINETAEERIKEVADTAEKYLCVEGFSDKFQDYMARGFYSLSTPVWINFGKNKGLPISCYGSNISDTMDSILNTAKEIGMMSKYGGGTSAYLGNIRPRGTAIKTGGRADGPVHYSMLYDTVVDVCKQSEARRGACAVYLPIEHPDIDDFLNIATEGNPIQNLQYGITVTDEWLTDMKNGDTNKRKLWAKVIQRRGEIGLPYIMFKDNSNKNTPYNEIGLDITASNLCLTADQRVVTSKGYLTVKELYESGEELILFSGKEAVKSSPMLLRNENAEILKITYSNGMTQKVTFNHGIPVIDDINGEVQRVEAKDLKIGDHVALQTEKGLFGDGDYPSHANMLGSRELFSADECYIPSWIWESNEDTVWAYLKSLLHNDGIAFTDREKGNSTQIAYANTDKSFLGELQILFTNLGLNCSIAPSEDCWGLIFDNNDDILLIEGKTQFLSNKKIIIEGGEHKGNSKKSTMVVAIEQIENEPVYCPTIYNDEHIFVSNGLRTFNCSEIQLPTDEDTSFVCCIGSINLLHWDEIAETDAVETYVQFLNAVMDEFIIKSKDMPGMERAYNFAVKHRSIGLGVLGYHSLLQSKLIEFESFQAKFYNNIIFRTLKERTDKASMALYESNPEKYSCLRNGFANTTLMAIAPTKSSSFILGQVSMGIEPIKSNYFVKDLAKIRTIYKNPYLLGELEKYNLNTEETWESILKKDGSVQHLDFPTKAVFKTFLEITPKEIIIQAAQRQKYIDQSQSLNLMIHPSIPAKDINQLYLFAHEQGVKTLYYQYSINSAQEYSRNILECVNCE